MRSANSQSLDAVGESPNNWFGGFLETINNFGSAYGDAYIRKKFPNQYPEQTPYYIPQSTGNPVVDPATNLEYQPQFSLNSGNLLMFAGIFGVVVLGIVLIRKL